MKRVLRTTMMALLVMMLLVGMMAPAAMAAYEPVEVSMPVTVYMKVAPADGELPDKDSVSVTVKTLTEGSPVVASPVVIECDGKTGCGKANITFGDFSKPGIHKYGITIGKSSLTDWVIDDKEVHYVVILSVVNNDAYTGLEIKVGIREAELVNGEYVYDETTTNKPDALDAEKTYAASMKITVSKHWPDGGARPIKVILYEVVAEGDDTYPAEKIDKKNRVELDNVYLTNSRQWQHTFTENPITGQKLDSRKEYVLDEVDLAGFSEIYKYNKSDSLHWYVTITNVKSLYQTGQLNWPIPVLVCMGSMLMLIGVVMLRKKEEQTYE